MKRILVIAFCMLAAASLTDATAQTQQRYLKVYSGGQEVYSVPTTGNNSLRFSGGNADFTHNGATTSFSLTAIDSLVFAKVTDSDPDTTSGSDTVAVDTASAISITWNGTAVDIVNPYASQGVSISADGGHVTVVSTLDSAYLPYLLGGSSSDGSLTITSAEKVLLQLGGLDLTSTSGPAINMTSDRKMVLDLAGENTLADAAGGSHKGALQAAGKLGFQGSGALNVSGMTKHGIQSSGRCTMNSGTVNVLTAVKDGMNVDDFLIYGGTVNVTNPNGDGIDGDQGMVAVYGGSITVVCTAEDAKGICCDSTITISGGSVNVTVSGNQSKGLKSGGNMTITDGETTVNANGTLVITNYDPSYCSGVKVGGNLLMTGGVLTSTCSSANAGGKAVNVDGNITVSGGTLTLSAPGNCAKYNNTATTYDSYASACLKANGNITIGGGSVTADAGGRAITTDGHYTQTGGTVSTTTSKAGFTVTGSGSSCTDGFAAACLKADSNITITGGSFSGTSTGTGGRGIVANGTLTIGTSGAADSLVYVYVTTSGATVNSTSSSSAWKGIAKGIKIEGNITVNSGHVQSYCSQTSGDPTGEAIESKDSIFIHGGYIEANAYDDPINAAIYYGQTGGYVWAYSRHNDAVDCNGTMMTLTGGVLIAIGSECAIDNNREASGQLIITGGTLIAVGGNMGAIESAPTCSGTQKGLTWGSSGGGWGGGGGTSLATNGFCVKTASGTEVLTFKMPTVSGSGFMNTTGTKPPGGGGGNSGTSAVYVSAPGITSGSYRVFTSPTVSGGSHWHGLYSGATVTTSGNGTSVTAQ